MVSFCQSLTSFMSYSSFSFGNFQEYTQFALGLSHTGWIEKTRRVDQAFTNMSHQHQGDNVDLDSYSITAGAVIQTIFM